MAGNSVPVEVVRDLFAYDAESGAVTWRRKGARSAIVGGPVGYPHSGGYLQIYFTGYYPQMLHRVIWAIVHGEWPKGKIDHRNGVRTDNRLVNLRVATNSENSQNLRSAKSLNKTGLLGVSKHRLSFVATIAMNGKRKYIGIFKTAEEAHKAYIAEKRRLHPFNTL